MLFQKRGKLRIWLEIDVVGQQGRVESQAPDIDSVVYLTDCDPSAYQSGDLVSASVVGARGYDLLAKPLG